MAVNVPCTRPTPPAPGQPNQQGGGFAPIQDLLLTPQTVPQVAAVRYITDLPLARLTTLYWLAVLCRTTYSATDALFRQCARACVPSTYPVTFVANGTGLTPGYGIITCPDFLVCAISGTTNLAQWLAQLLQHDLVPTNYPLGGGADNSSCMSLYKSAADTIAAAIDAADATDKPVLLTGHSMGGAVASVLHYKYRGTMGPRRPSRLVTFCAPKPGDSNLANRVRDSSQVLRRLWVKGDFIPALPPDLGVIKIVPPPFFAPWLASWARYNQLPGAYAIQESGALVSAEEEPLFLQTAAALLTIATGGALTIPGFHKLQTVTERLQLNWDATLPQTETRIWQQADLTISTNNQCTNLGII